MELDNYIARHAATVGRRVRQVKRPVWVPHHLPGADAQGCLGVLGEACERNENDAGRGVELLHDGQTMVTGKNNGQLRCYDLRTGVQTWASSDEGSGRITDIACSPDGYSLATVSDDGTVRLWDAYTGACRQRLRGHRNSVRVITWSPDGERLASASSDRTARIWDAGTGDCVRILSCGDSTWGVDWSPDGRFIATGSYDGLVRIWDADTGAEVSRYSENRGVVAVSWSPDGSRVATVIYVNENNISIWDVATSSRIMQCAGYSEFCISWSPDGNLLASGSYDNTVKIWDAHTGGELGRFTVPRTGWPNGGPFVLRVVWSKDMGFVVSSGKDDLFRVWDTRHLLKGQTVTRTEPTPEGPIPADMRLLPSALAQMHRLGIYPPLSLVKDMMDITGGKPGDNYLGELASSKGILELTGLRWSGEARIGLVALLLHKLPSGDEWKPPADVSPNQVRDALTDAMKGEAVEPEAPPYLMAPLQEAVEQIDDRMLSLLTMLGPDAVAADPGLPLKLLSRAPDLPALNATQRRLLGLRVRFGGKRGQSTGTSPTADRAQVGGVETGYLRTDWRALLPSQMVLPDDVFSYRHLRGELLFRAHEVSDPPRLRPTVLLLDVSPSAFGPVEKTTRLAAYMVGRTLLQSGVPVVLVTPGDRGELVHQLERPSDLVEVWTHRTLTPIDAVRSLRLSHALRASLHDGSVLDPIILVLSHPWFGADDTVSSVSGLRGLFVQYPGYHVRPALADLCERWHDMSSGETSDLSQILGYLMG